MSPEDAAKLFAQIGTGIFTETEDAEIIEGLTGKRPVGKEKLVDSKNKKAGSPDSSIFDSREEDDEEINPAIFDEDNISESAKIFGAVDEVTPSTSAAVQAIVQPLQSPPPRASPSLSVKEIEELQKSIDNLSDEQVERVFSKMRGSLGTKLYEAFNQSFRSKDGKPKKSPPISSFTSSSSDPDLRMIEAELKKAYEDPLSVWKELMANPDKYLDDEDWKKLKDIQ